MPSLLKAFWGWAPWALNTVCSARDGAGALLGSVDTVSTSIVFDSVRFSSQR